MKSPRTYKLLVASLGGVLLIGACGGAFATPALTGSEAVRAERCAGNYACDEDGSWASTDSRALTLSASPDVSSPDPAKPASFTGLQTFRGHEAAIVGR